VAVNHAKDGAPGFLTTRFEAVLAWGRKYSIWPFTFATACCGIEVMGAFGTHYDVARFGAEVIRFSPRQADMLLVAGTVNYKMAPVLVRIYEQMLEPKWVVAMGAQGIDKFMPVDIYIPGCPPIPEQIIDSIVLIQKLIDSGGSRARDRWPIKI
jgi:NADH-quinone oxidoreductase subunit B